MTAYEDIGPWANMFHWDGAGRLFSQRPSPHVSIAARETPEGLVQVWNLSLAHDDADGDWEDVPSREAADARLRELYPPRAEPPAIPITLPSTPELDAVSVPYEPVAPEPYWHGPPGQPREPGNGAVSGLREELTELVLRADDRSMVRDRHNSDAIGRCTDAIIRITDRIAALERPGPVAGLREDHDDLARKVRNMDRGMATFEDRLFKLEGWVRTGKGDVGPVAPLLGDHKEALAERARIVAWLRKAGWGEYAELITAIANDVDRGVHRVKP